MQFVRAGFDSHPLEVFPPPRTAFSILPASLELYIDIFESAVGVFNRCLDRFLIPENMLRIKPSGCWIGPVFVSAVPFNVFLLSVLIPVKGKIRGALGSKVDRFTIVYDSLELFVFTFGW